MRIKIKYFEIYSTTSEDIFKITYFSVNSHIWSQLNFELKYVQWMHIFFNLSKYHIMLDETWLYENVHTGKIEARVQKKAEFHVLLWLLWNILIVKLNQKITNTWVTAYDEIFQRLSSNIHENMVPRGNGKEIIKTINWTAKEIIKSLTFLEQKQKCWTLCRKQNSAEIMSISRIKDTSYWYWVFFKIITH